MEFEQRAQFLVGGFLQRPHLSPTGVVHQDVDATVAGGHIVDERDAGGGVGHVEPRCLHLIGVCAHQVVEPLYPAPCRHDHVPGLHRRRGQCAAETAGRSGDQPHPVR